MDKVNDNLISISTVRLRRNDLSNSTIGTGILYYKNCLGDKVYVLTASHCLFEDSDKFQNKLGSLFIDIYNPTKCLYESILYEQINENFLFKDSNKDVAVLILEKDDVDKINPDIPTIEVVQERRLFSSFVAKGFPQATKGEELDMIHAIWKQEMTESRRFQLQLSSDYTEYNTGGFSGAGIFLEAENEIFLYGIFTRYRSEGKGKVIYCQYIESINELLRNNFLSPISYTYLGSNGMTSSFFSSKTENAIMNLGPRFNEKINLELPIVKVFDSISKSEFFYERLKRVFDKWLTAKNYIQLEGNNLIGKIESEFTALKNELSVWLEEFDYSLTSIIPLNPFLEKIMLLNSRITEKQHEIYNLEYNDRAKNQNNRSLYDKELYALRTYYQANNDLIHDVDELNINLANYPTLIIQGEAGCGKSHLLGDIATQRINQNLPTLLLLGTTFSNTTIQKNILEKLDLTCSFKDFLENLNHIGLQINSRVMIFIDAINEGAGPILWKNQIAGFINEIAAYPAIGLVMTIRSTYFLDIITFDPKAIPSINIITHEGFKGNEYEALKLFCKHYKLKLPNFPILNPEFSNPLLLHTVCEAIQNLPNKDFPSGFNGINKIYNLYKESLNRKFEQKRDEYKYQNIVSVAIEKLAGAMFSSEYHHLNISDAAELLKSLNFPFLFSDLIEESVLIKMRYDYDIENPKDVVLFSYQKLGDFFMAEELLKPFETKEQIRNAFANDAIFKKIAKDYQWLHRGIIEAFSILLPERYDLELFELIDFFFDKNSDKRNTFKFDTYESFTRMLLDSMKWRELSSLNEKKITGWLEKKGKLIHDEWWYSLTELTPIPNHPFNSDRLHRILMRYSMSERDGFWQNYMLSYRGYNDDNIAFPLRRLIDWAWSPNISQKVDLEMARLVAQTLSWVLSSTDIKLRDQTTKALVNLLEQQPEVLIKTLNAFESIDDLYILERLYAVAYGCILRTEKDDSIILIAQYVYDVIFKDGNPPIHILLRDYSRNVIEYAISKNLKLDIEKDLIRPPYNSKMPILPSNAEDMKKYHLDYNDPNFRQNYGSEHNAIYNSLLGDLADFGHYTVESQVEYFESFSFKEDENYKSYIKTLKREQRDFLKLLLELMKQEAAFNKKNRNQKYLIARWTKYQQEYIDLLDSTKEMCMGKMNDALSKEQFDYVKENILPYYNRKFKIERFNPYPVRNWIVERVFKLGYDRTLHGLYDSLASRVSFRSENKIERIGKKYQWIAFFEILAMLADNYKIKRKWSSDDNFNFYKGAWQLSIRNIDPAYITKEDNKDDENLSMQSSNEWWEDTEYTHWNYPDSEWVKKTEDLIDPKTIIEKKDANGEGWLHLEHFVEWEEPKKIGRDKYDGRWKKLYYRIQGCLIKKTDKQKIINYLKDKNFWGNWLPENRDVFSNLINREKFWSPAFIDTNKNNKKIWDTIRDTRYKVIVATESANGGIENDKSGANHSYNIPCKYIFEGMKLRYAPVDGRLKNDIDEVIVRNSNPKSVLMRKKDLVKFLDDNNLDIIWTLLGEKFSFDNSRCEESHFKVPCGVYYIVDGKLKGEVNMYDRD